MKPLIQTWPGAREGLRIPLTLDPFEALVWAILGQQVNLAFAYALRRDLIMKAQLLRIEGAST